MKKYIIQDYSVFTFKELEFLNSDFKEKDFEILKLSIKNLQEKIDKKRIIVNRRNIKNNQILKILDTYKDKKMTQGIVGVFKNNVFYENEKYDVEVTIKSRFDKKIEQPFFLISMLCENIFDSQDFFSNMNDVDIFSLFNIYLFKNAFEMANRMGFFKKYITFEEEGQKLKGSINFKDRIEQFKIKDGKIRFIYTDRTTINPENKLFLSAYKVLKRKYPKIVNNIMDNTNAKENIEKLIDEVGYFKFDINSILNKSRKSINHPLYADYERLRKLSIKILREEKVSPFQSENDDTEAILYYIPDLWEEFLEKNFFPTFEEEDFESKYQKKIKLVSGKISIIPDFVVYNKEDKPLAILDAKFKPLWSEGDYDSADLTKCLRDVYVFNCDIGGVIFPSNTNIKSISKAKISEYNSNFFYRIPIEIPDIDNCLDFKEFFTKFKKIIKGTSERFISIMGDCSEM